MSDRRTQTASEALQIIAGAETVSRRSRPDDWEPFAESTRLLWFPEGREMVPFDMAEIVQTAAGSHSGFET